jgi:hypothetical protein
MARLAWPLLAATLGERVRYDQCLLAVAWDVGAIPVTPAAALQAGVSRMADTAGPDGRPAEGQPARQRWPPRRSAMKGRGAKLAMAPAQPPGKGGG